MLTQNQEQALRQLANRISHANPYWNEQSVYENLYTAIRSFSATPIDRIDEPTKLNRKMRRRNAKFSR